MVEKPDPRRSEIEPADQATVNWEEMAAIAARIGRRTEQSNVIW